MLQKVTTHLGLLVCLIFMIAGTRSEAQVVPWFGVGAGISTYTLDDVNAEIRYLDAQIAESFSEINQGYHIAAEAGLDVDDQFRFGGHYQRLLASSEVSDQSGTLKYNFPANLIFGSVSYLPQTLSAIRPVVGASGGMIYADGSIDISLVGLGSASGSITGNGYYLGAHISLEIPVGYTGAFIPQLSYRYAKIPTVSMEGETIYNNDGTKYTLDYSGVVLTVSLRFFIKPI